MAGQFEEIKSEVITRLAGNLIPRRPQGAISGTLIQSFHRVFFDRLLAIRGKVMDPFLTRGMTRVGYDPGNTKINSESSGNDST